jgi:hypothetical protein
MTRGEVFVKFVDKTILGEQGRLLFSVVNAFARVGYQVWLFDSFPEDELGKYGRLSASLDRVRLTNAIPTATDHMIYVYDRQDSVARGRRWRKRVNVRYDIFARYWFQSPIFLPFPVHPAHAGPDLGQRCAKGRASPRRMRIFFAGDVKGYDRNRIRFPSDKLTRGGIVDAIIRRMGSDAVLLKDANELEALVSSDDYLNKCVLVYADRFRIDERRWLETIATADFFLCPPGYVMPMCHNAIEAMAVGTIPLINYPEWFRPPLRHLENCIAFSDEDNLIERIRAILEMSEQQMLEMKAGAIKYYEEQLTAETFLRHIECNSRKQLVTLLMTERYVAGNAAKLGPRSALMRSNVAGHEAAAARSGAV